ncbi:hypothetical protein RchiOBHm_Chr5g0064751 [Rosa chinensis]|uniref:Uncharacterized protein n=1 Tax=Rosa chinensis TaxID=74649 RepID=A0A2P6QIR9_ROSCH|nr:hypothetical protein RchiOBHm_Chr5g0064751 [Rosa chinensis]
MDTQRQLLINQINLQPICLLHVDLTQESSLSNLTASSVSKFKLSSLQVSFLFLNIRNLDKNLSDSSSDAANEEF